MIEQPALPRSFVDAMMDAGVIQHDHGWAVLVCREQAINKVGASAPLTMHGVEHRVPAEIQCTNCAAAAVMVFLDLVRHPRGNSYAKPAAS